MHTQPKDGVTVVTADSVILTPMEAQIVRQLFANFMITSANVIFLAEAADTTPSTVRGLMRDLGVGSDK